MHLQSIEMISSLFIFSLPEFNATLIIPLMKFDSNRSLNLKYFVPPMIDMIKRGAEIFQTSVKILSTLASGVSKANCVN